MPKSRFLNIANVSFKATRKNKILEFTVNQRHAEMQSSSPSR